MDIEHLDRVLADLKLVSVGGPPPLAELERRRNRRERRTRLAGIVGILVLISLGGYLARDVWSVDETQPVASTGGSGSEPVANADPDPGGVRLSSVEVEQAAIQSVVGVAVRSSFSRPPHEDSCGDRGATRGWTSARAVTIWPNDAGGSLAETLRSALRSRGWAPEANSHIYTKDLGPAVARAYVDAPTVDSLALVIEAPPVGVQRTGC
jgi:hypothetical protein